MSQEPTTAVYSATAQNLNAIRWSTTIDLNTSGAFAHFGSPLLTPANTIVVPVKTATDGFQLKVLTWRSNPPARRATPTCSVWIRRPSRPNSKSS